MITAAALVVAVARPSRSPKQRALGLYVQQTSHCLLDLFISAFARVFGSASQISTLTLWSCFLSSCFAMAARTGVGLQSPL
jgi:membrane-bound metal-dependent hydrolase YbcI (DUF457 family)